MGPRDAHRVARRPPRGADPARDVREEEGGRCDDHRVAVPSRDQPRSIPVMCGRWPDESPDMSLWIDDADEPQAPRLVIGADTSASVDRIVNPHSGPTRPAWVRVPRQVAVLEEQVGVTDCRLRVRDCASGIDCPIRLYRDPSVVDNQSTISATSRYTRYKTKPVGAAMPLGRSCRCPVRAQTCPRCARHVRYDARRAQLPEPVVDHIPDVTRNTRTVGVTRS